MKKIRLYVTETVEYDQTFEVSDDFDINDDEAVEGVWIEGGNFNKVDAVTARQVSVAPVLEEVSL